MNNLLNLKIFDILNIYVVKFIKFILYIIEAIIIYKIAKFIFQKTIQNKFSHRYLHNKKIKMIITLGLNIIKYLIYFIAILLILRDVFNINPALIITATGVLGLAFGLGIQGVLRDFISGLSILFENQFNVGDYIEFLNIKGRVININIKNVTVKDRHGNISIISNGIINRITKFIGKYEQVQFHIFHLKEIRKINTIHLQLKKNYLQRYNKKINSFGKLIKNKKTGILNHADFTVEIEPFNDEIIESIKQLLLKSIPDLYIHIDRRPA